MKTVCEPVSVAWLLRTTRTSLSPEGCFQGAAREVDAARTARRTDLYCIFDGMMKMIDLTMNGKSRNRKEKTKKKVKKWREKGNRELAVCFGWLLMMKKIM